MRKEGELGSRTEAQRVWWRCSNRRSEKCFLAHWSAVHGSPVLKADLTRREP
jgi:hypothetical protein